MLQNFRQFTALFCFVDVYALLAFLVFALGLYEQLAAGQTIPSQFGYWLSRRLELPGVYREHAGWRARLL